MKGEIEIENWRNLVVETIPKPRFEPILKSQNKEKVKQIMGKNISIWTQKLHGLKAVETQKFTALLKSKVTLD